MKSSQSFTTAYFRNIFNRLEPINVILATQQYVFTSITYAPNSDVCLFRMIFTITLCFLAVCSRWHKYRFSDGLPSEESSTRNNRTYFVLSPYAQIH